MPFKPIGEDEAVEAFRNECAAHVEKLGVAPDHPAISVMLALGEKSLREHYRSMAAIAELYVPRTLSDAQREELLALWGRETGIQYLQPGGMMSEARGKQEDRQRAPLSSEARAFYARHEVRMGRMGPGIEGGQGAARRPNPAHGAPKPIGHNPVG